jgi:hypothetical protein
MRNRTRLSSILHLPSSLLVFFLALTTNAQTNIDLMIKPFQERVPIEFNAGAAMLAAGHTDTANDYQFTLVDLTTRYRFLPDQRIDPRIGAAVTYLNFDSDDPRLPDAMIDTSVAVGFGVYENQSGWQAGVTLGVGYAGVAGPQDNFFTDGNAWYPKTSFVLGKKINKTDAILLVLDYDANRTYKPDIPFPGFAYQKLIFGNPDPTHPDSTGPFQPQLLLTLGVPYAALHWEPIERLAIDLSSLIPDDFGARGDYDFVPKGKLGLFASLDTRRNGFHVNTLRHGDDRILFYQRRAELGLRWTPAHKVNLIVAGGYAFGQELTTGFDTSNDHKLADLGDRPYVRFGLEVGF